MCVQLFRDTFFFGSSEQSVHLWLLCAEESASSFTCRFTRPGTLEQKTVGQLRLDRFPRLVVPAHSWGLFWESCGRETRYE